MPLPLAVIAMVLILAGFALYVMLAFRLYKQLRTAVQQRGYKSPVVLTGAGCIGCAGRRPASACGLLAAVSARRRNLR